MRGEQRTGSDELLAGPFSQALAYNEKLLLHELRAF